MHLAPCPSCARHVRSNERVCPFCQSPLDAAFRATPAPRSPAARLGRAALVAFAAACNPSGPVPAYGGPPPPPPEPYHEAPTPTAADAGQPLEAGPVHAQPSAPAYGAPPQMR